MSDYTEREMRLISERDAAITRAERLEHRVTQLYSSCPIGFVDGRPITTKDTEDAEPARLRDFIGWLNELGELATPPGQVKPKAIITLTDGDEDGEVNCSIDFIPPVEKGGYGTPAQAHALEMLGASLKKAKKHSEPVFRAPRKKR